MKQGQTMGQALGMPVTSPDSNRGPGLGRKAQTTSPRRAYCVPGMVYHPSLPGWEEMMGTAGNARQRLGNSKERADFDLGTWKVSVKGHSEAVGLGESDLGPISIPAT